MPASDAAPSFPSHLQSMQKSLARWRDAAVPEESAMERFRAEVTEAAALLFSRVPEAKADPVLRNFFTKLVSEDFRAFYDRMAKSHCLPLDLAHLTRRELAAIYLFKGRVLECALPVYDAHAEADADRLLHAFFTELLNAPVPATVQPPT